MNTLHGWVYVWSDSSKKVHLVAKTHHEVDLEVYSLLMLKYLLVPTSQAVVTTE